MNQSVLIIARNCDRSIERVTEMLHSAGEKVFTFVPGDIPLEATLKVRFINGKVSGVIVTSDGCLKLEDVKSCWYRSSSPPTKTPKDMHKSHIMFIREEIEAALWGLYTSLNVFWMNPPLSGIALVNKNKLHQLTTAANIGLPVPETIVTNDVDELRAFCRQCDGGEAVVKLMSAQAFVKEGESGMLGIYTRKITEKDLAQHEEDITVCPIMAQQYIPKQFELRVTIVGKEVFVCKIDSQNSERTREDWRRYDFDNVAHSSYDLPRKTKEKLLELMQTWQLQFGAIDMIVTPSNEHVFLEINPQGQWDWIEQLTGMPITKAIANLLSAPPF